MSLWNFMINKKKGEIVFELRILWRSKVISRLALATGNIVSSPWLSSLPNFFQVSDPTISFFPRSSYFSLAAAPNLCHFRTSEMEAPLGLLSPAPSYRLSIHLFKWGNGLAWGLSLLWEEKPTRDSSHSDCLHPQQKTFSGASEKDWKSFLT